MKNTSRSLLALLLCLNFACSKDSAELDCSQVNLTFSTSITNTPCGVANGSIIVTPDPGLNIVRYKLDDQAFQNSGEFTSLTPGEYMITVENEEGCSKSSLVVIRSGISFKTSVAPIIAKSCAISACHDGSGNIDYRVFANLNPADMKARMQSGNMPKVGSLTKEEIDAIACWVDDGAMNN